MDLQSYVDEVKFQLTGGVLELELEDSQIVMAVTSALRELQRYISTTVFETIPYSHCIDLNPRKINSIARVFRTTATGVDSSNGSSLTDPVLASSWQLLCNGSVNNLGTYVNNYSSWMLTQQIRNTMSTDMSYVYDDQQNKLYINTAHNEPESVTIEYVPRFDDVSQIKSDYWVDMLVRLSVAITKVVLGRIRSKYTQSNALWSLDGATILQEGKDELEKLRDALATNSQLSYPVD